MDPYKKQARKVSLSEGLVLATAVTGVSAYSSSLVQNVYGVLVLLVAFIGLFVLGYRKHYVANMEAHDQLMETFGEKYTLELDKALSERSMRKLMHTNWFVKRAETSGDRP